MPTVEREAGVELHWRASGEGPAVVICDNLFSVPEALDGLQTDLLRDHTVLRYDPRGAGRSTPLGEYATAENILTWTRAVRGTWWAPFALVGAYVAGAFVLFPRPVLTLVAVMFNLVWFYASGGGGRLLRPDHDPDAVKGISRSYRPAPYIYAVMTLVAFVAPVAAVLLYGGFALFWMIESSLFGRSRTAQA